VKVRLFLSLSIEMVASFEVRTEAKSYPPTLFDPPSMKLSIRSAFRALARLSQDLRPLHKQLREWLPQPAPVLVPIPVRTAGRVRDSVGRHPYRGR
jgi:hypothetical protein